MCYAAPATPGSGLVACTPADCLPSQAPKQRQITRNISRLVSRGKSPVDAAQGAAEESSQEYVELKEPETSPPPDSAQLTDAIPNGLIMASDDGRSYQQLGDIEAPAQIMQKQVEKVSCIQAWGCSP